MLPESVHHPRFLVVPCLALLALLTLTAGFLRPSDHSEGVQIRLTSVDLKSDSTFELRFDQPVAALDEIGQTARSNPLRVDPPLPGSFVWKSRRSGLFTPARRLELDTEYRFTLRSDLHGADGKPVKARLTRSFHTPPLALEIGRAGGQYWAETNAIPWPRFQVSANVKLEADQLRRHAQFRNSRKRVPVEVVPMTNGLSIYPLPVQLSAWLPSTNSEARYWQMSEGNSTNGYSRYLVLPEKPLPPGERWELEIIPGLTSQETSARTTIRFHSPVGTVRPFQVEQVTAHSPHKRERNILVRLNRDIRTTVTNDPPEKWIQCVPGVSHLHWIECHGGTSMTVGGDFELRKSYEISMASAFSAETGELLGKSHAIRVEFSPIQPAAWLATEDAAQLASGLRSMELLVVNQAQTRLRIKRLDTHTLIHTLRAYERYTGRHTWEKDAAPPERLDYAGVAGTTVLDTNLVTRAEEDTALKVPLNWDSLVGRETPGAYFLQVDVVPNAPPNGGRPLIEGPQSLIQLTDLGLEVKSGQDKHAVHVFSHRTGRPLAGVNISIRSDENQLLEQGVTDSDGNLALTRHSPPTPANQVMAADSSASEPPTASMAIPSLVPAESWVLAEFGTDLHAVRLGEGDINLWQFNVPIAGYQGNEPSPLFSFTDREAYRPGESIHFKLLARRQGPDGWEFPTNRIATLTVTDPRQMPWIRTNLTLEQGSADWNTVLTSDVRRGRYEIKWEVGSKSTVTDVQVRDFQPPAFEVILTNRHSLAPDEPVNIHLTARYLFGTPLSRATVHWTLEGNRSPLFADDWQGFGFSGSEQDWDFRWSRAYGLPDSRIQLNGTAEWSDQTQLTIAPELPITHTNLGPVTYSFIAEVTDQNQQTETQSTTFVQQSSDFYLGFRWKQGEEAIMATNQPLEFELVAVTGAGQPVNEPQDVTVQLQRVDWKTTRVLGAGRTVDFRSEPHFYDLGTQTYQTLPCVRTRERWTVAADPSRKPLVVPALSEPGSYALICRSSDSAHRPVETRVSFYVTGDGRVAWNYKNGSALTLIPNKTEYHTGDTATLLLQTPFDGTAWVTTERENVRSTQTLEVHGNAPTIQIPLGPQEAPNVMVGVTLIRGHGNSPHEFPMPEWRFGYIQLKVTDPMDRLGVQVASQQNQYAPGETVSVEAKVMDAHDHPAAGAEVTLYAVDEAYLLMTASSIPDPLEAFHQPHPLAVKTGLWLHDLVSENPELRRFDNKGSAGGGGGRMNRTRSQFEPCPYWNAHLVTDADGLVRIRFPAPDSLTRYRLVAVATRGPRQFGSGAGAFEVRKELMIEPSVPPVAHVGDRLLARALVFNQSGQPLNATVWLQTGRRSLSALTGSTNRELSLAPGQSVPVEFPVEFQTVGVDTWIWRVEASTNGIRPDTVEKVMTILDAGTEIRDQLHLRWEGQPNGLLSGINPEVRENLTDLHIRISPSPIAFLAEGVSELLHYPYGCIEQTASSLVPWLALRDQINLIPPDLADPVRMTNAIHSGIRRLFSMQTASGGLGYWPGDATPQLWGSAYGCLVLGLARDAGYPVPDLRLNLLTDWLQKSWMNAEPGQPVPWSIRCLIAASLARIGKNTDALQATLNLNSDLLGMEDRALLALSMAWSQGDTNQALGLLKGPVPGRLMAGPFGNRSRAQAISFLAWLTLAPSAAETGAKVDELLMSQRRGHWDTTQGNAWAIWALSAYAHRSGASVPTVIDLHFSDAQLDAATLDTRLLEQTSEQCRLLREVASFPTLFVDVAAIGHRKTRSLHVEPISHGFSVARTYSRLDDANHTQSLTGLTVGDRVLVTLDIESPDNAAWVAIEDPLPAVFEAVQGVFKTEQSSATALLPDWTSDFQEFRKDRTVFFRNSLPEGRHSIRYLARVRTAGTAVAAPTHIEAMYEPDRHGLSSGGEITVRGAN